MPPFYGPSWGPAGRRRTSADPNLRVSDAERTAVADRLSRHYGDGRLDQEEFNERLERAMHAKTQADLSGLLDDLPPLEEPGTAGPPRPRHFPLRFFVLVFLIVFAAVAWHGVAHPFFFFPFFFVPFPWLLIGLLAFLWLRRRRGRWDGDGTR